MTAGRRWLGPALAVVALLLLVGVLVLTGLVRLPGNDEVSRPPCGQLPSRAEVVQALEDDADLTALIEEVGDVQVDLASPCDDSSRALVRVTYGAASERDEVERILEEVDGFGVPLEMVEG